MYFSTCVFSLAVMLIVYVVDVRTGALQHQDLQSRRCHSCTDYTACEQTSCPTERPYCATIARSPDFSSTLTCSTVNEKPCSLLLATNQTFELTCTCSQPLCNAPYTGELTEQLMNFTSTFNITNNNTDLTDLFFKTFNNSLLLEPNTQLVNKLTNLTVDITTSTVISYVTEKVLNVNVSKEHVTKVDIETHFMDAPRAEALKHEVTAPSDDEEDESEGSGEEDSRSLKRPGSAPSAPSSYLPANENKASPLLRNLFLTTPLILCFIV